jgi:hypothetical protein
MVGGAAERDRQVERGETRIDQVEQRRVFDGEHRADPRIGGVVDRQRRLQAIDFRIGGEARRGEPQLIGVGFVLGVIDDDQRAARRRQRDVERARLGRRQAGRGDDDFIARRQVERLERGPRGGVVAFDDQLDVELAARIIAALGSKLT